MTTITWYKLTHKVTGAALQLGAVSPSAAAESAAWLFREATEDSFVVEEV